MPTWLPAWPSTGSTGPVLGSVVGRHGLRTRRHGVGRRSIGLPTGRVTAAWPTCGTFSLPGGERAVREPRRSALGLLYEILGQSCIEHVRAWFTPAELEGLVRLVDRPQLCPRTSSMGRLFDAVAALVRLAAW